MCGIYSLIRDSKKVRDEQIKPNDGSGNLSFRGTPLELLKHSEENLAA